MFSSFLINSYCFYILNTWENKFLGSTGGRSVTAEAGVDPSEFYIRRYDKSRQDFYLGVWGTKDVLDIRGGGLHGDLILFKYHGLINQRFRVVLTADNNFMIMQRGYCLYYNKHDRKLHLTDCKNTYASFFKFYFSFRTHAGEDDCEIENMFKTKHKYHKSSSSSDLYQGLEDSSSSCTKTGHSVDPFYNHNRYHDDSYDGFDYSPCDV